MPAAAPPTSEQPIAPPPRPRIYRSTVVVFLLAGVWAVVINWGGRQGDFTRLYYHGRPWSFAEDVTYSSDPFGQVSPWELPPRRVWRWRPLAANIVVCLGGATLLAVLWQRRRLRRTRLLQFSLADGLLATAFVAAIAGWFRSQYRETIAYERIRENITRSGEVRAGVFDVYRTDWFWESVPIARSWKPMRISFLRISVEVLNDGSEPTLRTASIAADIGHLTHLQTLSIEDVRFGPELFAGAIEVPRLMHVHLRSQHLEDAHFEPLARLPKLELLDLQGGCYTDQGLARLQPCSSLESLMIRNSAAVRGTTLGQLRKLSNLTLRKIAIDDEGMAAIATLPNLSELEIEECDQITSVGWQELAACRSLRRLNVTTPADNQVSPNFVRWLEEILPKTGSDFFTSQHRSKPWRT